MQEPPNENINLVRKFEETGDRPKSGSRSLSDERTDAVKEAVREIVAINKLGVSSVRSISQSNCIPTVSYTHLTLPTNREV